MDLAPLLERWIPVILVSLLFFALVRALLGAAFRALLRPWMLGVLALLIVFGVIPLSGLGDALAGSLVLVYEALHRAYEVALASATVG